MRKDTHTYSHMHGELQQLIDRAQELVDATAGKLDDGIQSARDALVNGLEDARWQAADLEDRVRVRTDQAQSFVEEKPYQAVGYSFMAGIFLGWLLSK
ncbi:MAG: hypothetical protein Q4G66_09905 [bacterium]|nr:hypothetical protein [bacterium]